MHAVSGPISAPQARVEAAFARKRPWKLIAVAAWLFATQALAGWWLVFGLRQLDRLSTLDVAASGELSRQHRMLMSEGAVLFALLFGGGASLLYYIWVEIRRARQVAEFFAAFTHDLKTSLASLRLQAESLEEDMRDSPQSNVLRRLVKDTVRLEIQLENSLFLSSPGADHSLYYEVLELAPAVSRLSHHWPEIAIEIEGRARVQADRRALESILKNLVQNAVVHGKAKHLRISVRPRLADGPVEIDFADDGIGFAGDVASLGHLFRRHAPTSGSGIGLPLAMRLAEQMGGRLSVTAPASTGHGFGARLHLRAAP